MWRFEDFRGLTFSAVAQALSRLTRQGAIERLSKGVYYRNRETTLGKSRPNPASIRNLALRRNTMFPSGIAAANLLGFTTQIPKQGEIATSALSLPRKLVGKDTRIHTRRPQAWATLSETDAALLDFLRHGAEFSEPGKHNPKVDDPAVRTRTPRSNSHSCRFRTPPCSGHAWRTRRATGQQSPGFTTFASFSESTVSIRFRDTHRIA